MAKRIRYGVVVNNEHTKVFDTEQEAQEYIIAEKAQIARAIEQGWCHPKTTIRDFRLHIEQVKSKHW